MKKYCVIGQKLSHTLSPFIHKTYFDKNNIKAEYSALEIEQNHIKSCKKLLKEYQGCNVTVPYKEDIISNLDSLSQEVMDIGAVNTIELSNDKLIGHNTDWYGFGYLLECNNIDAKDKDIVILGTGGASKAVIYYLRQKGAKSIIMVSRSKDNNSGIRTIDYNELRSTKGDIIINTTPLGMSPNVDTCPINYEIASNFKIFVDLVYNPSFTKFCKLGASQGKLAVSGLYMLVAQAMKSQEIWQDKPIDKSIITEIHNKLLLDYFNKNNGNIFLIGMMSSGKSTVGKLLSQQTNMNFVDMDDYIQKISTQTIAQLFEKGESHFREWEAKAVYQLSLLKNTIVACGGGVVKSPINIATMHMSGNIVWLDKDIDKIVQEVDTTNRPLLKDGANKLYEIFEQRKPLYEQSCDIRLSNNDLPQNAVDSLITIFKR